MFKSFLRVLSLLCAGMTGFLIWQDLTNTLSASVSLGNIWYEMHPRSLQMSESIISRYVDPCELLIALDCTPFLWHPLIATLLGWPAGLIGFALTGILWFFGRRKQRYVRASKRTINI